MNNTQLNKYAELLVKVGVNLQKGERLVVSSPVSAADLTRKVVKVAYKYGASCVEVLWNDNEISKQGYKHRSKKSLAEVPEWVADQWKYYIDEKICYLKISSSDPEAFKGVNPEKMAISRRASGRAMRCFHDYTSSNKIRWAIGAYPNRAWAKKMFPDLKANIAEKKLWDYIVKSVRLDCEDPILAWLDHQENIVKRCQILTDAKITSFTYKNSLGTNLTVGMPKDYIFCGGAEMGVLDSVLFTANIPTEEVFSCPDRNAVNGRLVASMPLCSSGTLIKDFWFEFKDGRIVDYGASEGYEVLKNIIETDEGSHYLGEIALVGYNSPINNLNALFYTTLFDENASCHFAIGACYPTCIKGGGDMTTEQLLEKGLNDSLEHVDFMVGTKDLSITAETEDGKTITVFKDGDWVF